MTSRFPEPWRIVKIPNGFAVEDGTGRQLGVFYGQADPNGHADILVIEEARQIAVDFARLPELLKRTSGRNEVAPSPDDDKPAEPETSRLLQGAPETWHLTHGPRHLNQGSHDFRQRGTIPNHISSGPDGWIPAPSLRRGSHPIANRTKLLIEIAIWIAALPVGYYFIFGNWDRSVAPQAKTDIPPIAFAPLQEAEGHAAKATEITTESRVDPPVQTASLQHTGRLDTKPTESGIEAGPQQTLPELQHTGRLDTKPTESGIEAGPQQTLPERADQSLPAGRSASTCFPSASAVRQNYPAGWPSWTLKAPGHEGTRCWYAAARPPTHDPRSEIRRKETVPTTEKPEPPFALFGVK